MTATRSGSKVDFYRAARGGSAAAAVLIGMVGVVGAPPASPESTVQLAVGLTAGGSASASDIADMILQQQREFVDTFAALPFARPETIAQFPGYAQMLASFELQGYLAELNPMDQSFRYPYMLSGVGGNPIPLEGDPNPDNIFNMAFIQPDGTYVINFTPGPGTVDFNVTPQLNFSPSNVASQPLPALSLKDLTPNADGSYTITVSPTPQEGNWLDSGGASGLWMRSTLGDWTATPGSATIERVDIPMSTGTGYTPLSDDGVTALLDKIATTLPLHNLTSQFFYTPYPGLPLLENQVMPILPTDIEGGLPGQYMSIGGFKLNPGEALIITEPKIDAEYYNIQLFDSLTRMLPYQYSQTSLNNFQAVPNADGNTYYVLSDTNPGVPNWLDTTGLSQGGIFMRFQGPHGELPSAPFQTQVVSVEDVRDYLPAGTPTVTPQEFAEQLDLRSFSLQNALSATKDHSWITGNLQIDDIKDAIGSAKFNEIFGVQDTIVSLSERFTHHLSLLDAAENIFNNPFGSLAAVLNALPQTINDLQYPIVLAAARTADAIADAMQANGADSSATQALEIFEALGSVFAQAIFDPDTSITAGLLNARDDILFALVAGVRDTPDPAQLMSDAQESLAQTAAAMSENASLAAALIDQILGF